MKLVSPFHRGTTCTCRWSRTPAPADAAFVQADIEAVGVITAPSARMPTWTSAMTSASSSAVALEETAPVTRGGGHQMAGGIGKGVEDEEGLARAAKDERPAVIASGERIAEDAADAVAQSRRHRPRPSVDVTYAIRHGAQRRSTRGCGRTSRC